MIAATPMPPAVHTEIRPRPPLLGQQLGEVAEDARAGRRERMARTARLEPLHVELGTVDRAERRIAAEEHLAVVRVLPGLQRRQHLRGERLVDLVEVEVLQFSCARSSMRETAIVGAISSPSPATKLLAASCE